MKKIAIYQTNLNIGGISIALQNLLKSHIFDNDLVDLYLFSGKIDKLPDFGSNVTIFFLKPFKYINRFVKYDLLYRNINLKNDKEYDVAIDFNSYSNECSLFCLKTKAKKHIMWIHNDVRVKLKNEMKYRILWFFFKGKFKYYDEFVAVSEGARDSFKKKVGIYNKKIWVIPNYVDAEQIIRKSNIKCKNVVLNQRMTNIITIGCLNKQKGIDLLIRDMKVVIQYRDDIVLYIMGGGTERKKLEKMVRKLRLQNNIVFLGERQNPYSILKNMDAFILNSRYEGQGIVLVEADILGIPLIFPKRLEKYTFRLNGCDNVIESIISLKKSKHNTNSNYNYKNYVEKELFKLINFESDKEK